MFFFSFLDPKDILASPKYRKVVFYWSYTGYKSGDIFMRIFAYLYICNLKPFIFARPSVRMVTSTIEVIWSKFLEMILLDPGIPLKLCIKILPSPPLYKHNWFYSSIAQKFVSCLRFSFFFFFLRTKSFFCADFSAETHDTH